jgi:hypothetical protein
MASSHGNGLRILAGSIVIVIGLLLASYGMFSDIFEQWHGSDDPRPWCFFAGLFMAAVGSATAIDGLVGPRQRP